MQELEFKHEDDAAEELVRLILFGTTKRAIIVGINMRNAKFLAEKVFEVIRGYYILDKRFVPIYHSPKLMMKFPNGTEIRLYSAEEPERLRGMMADTAWVCSPSSWKNPDFINDVNFVLRLGEQQTLIKSND